MRFNIDDLNDIYEQLQTMTGGSGEGTYTRNLAALNGILALILNMNTQSKLSGIPVDACGSMVVTEGDCNDLITSGFYNCIVCQNAAYQYAAMFVLGYVTAGYCVQIQFDVNTNSQFSLRVMTAGAWSAWKVFNYVDVT